MPARVNTHELVFVMRKFMRKINEGDKKDQTPTRVNTYELLFFMRTFMWKIHEENYVKSKLM